MLIDTTTEDNVLIISLNEKRLTADIATEFTKTVTVEIEKNPEGIILDMKEIEFMDSSGLGSIMAIRKATTGVCKMKICSVGSSVMDILKLTRMNQVLDIYETPELAKVA